MTAYELNTEKVLLGEIISAGDLSKANADTFKDKKHKIIYRTMLELEANNRPINFANLQARLKETDRLEEIGGVSGLASVTISTIQLIEAKTGLTEDILKQITQTDLNKKDLRKEGNLIEYPIAVLNPKKQGRFIEGNYLVTKNKDRQIISRVGSIAGVLTPFDYDVFACMLTFGTEAGGNWLFVFSDYALLKKLNKGLSGRSYSALQKSKEKIATLNFYIPHFVKTRKEAIGVFNYPFLQASYITNLKNRKPVSHLHYNYFVLSPYFTEGIKERYFTWLDWDIWKKLKTPLAKRLYEYLKKKRGGNKKVYSESIQGLCERLPLANPRQDTLKKALDIVQRAGEIKGYNFKDNNVNVFFHSKRKARPKISTNTLNSAEAETYKRLLGAGVNPIVSIDLLSKLPAGLINRQIEWLPYRKCDKNKAGLLVKSIKENWPLPVEAEKRQGRREEGSSPILNNLINKVASSMTPKPGKRTKKGQNDTTKS